MGIQINGQTDTISASDGGLAVSGYELTGASNINVTGIVTATTFNGDVKVATGSTISGGTNFITASTNGSERVRIDSSGNFGIGTTAPDSKLHSVGTTILGTGTYPTGSIGLSDARTAILSSTENQILLIGNTNATVGADKGAEIYLGAKATTGSENFSSAKIGGFKSNSTSGNFESYLSFSTSNSGGTSTERMYINSNGHVTTPYQPSWNLRPNGSANNTLTADSFVGWSDNTSGSSSKLCHVQGVTLTGSSSGVLGATSTGRINFPVTGKYKVWCTIRCENMPGQGNIYLYINGTKLARQHVEAWGSTYGMPYFHGFHSHILNVAQGDYLEIQLSVPSGAIVSGYNDTVNWCGGYLIG